MRMYGSRAMYPGSRLHGLIVNRHLISRLIAESMLAIIGEIGPGCGEHSFVCPAFYMHRFVVKTSVHRKLFGTWGGLVGVTRENCVANIAT